MRGLHLHRQQAGHPRLVRGFVDDLCLPAASARIGVGGVLRGNTEAGAVPRKVRSLEPPRNSYSSKSACYHTLASKSAISFGNDE